MNGVHDSTGENPLPQAVIERKDAARRIGFLLSIDDRVGRLLAVLAAGVRPGARVLELGTGVGVGLAWVVHGLAHRVDVSVVSIEQSARLHRAARGRAWPEGVDLLCGDALALLPGLGRFDLIFADAEGGKLEGLDLTLAALSEGGTLVLDDMDHRPGDPTQAPFWPRLAAIEERLRADDRLLVSRLSWATGVILAARVGGVPAA